MVAKQNPASAACYCYHYHYRFRFRFRLELGLNRRLLITSGWLPGNCITRFPPDVL